MSENDSCRTRIHKWIAEKQESFQAIPVVKFLIPCGQQLSSFNVDLLRLLDRTKYFDAIISEVINASNEVSYIPIPLFGESSPTIASNFFEALASNSRLDDYTEEMLMFGDRYKFLLPSCSGFDDCCIHLNGESIATSVFTAMDFTSKESDTICFSHMYLSSEISEAFYQKYGEYGIHTLKFENCVPAENIVDFLGGSIPVSCLTIKNCGMSIELVRDVLGQLYPEHLQHADFSGNAFNEDSPQWQSIVQDHLHCQFSL